MANDQSTHSSLNSEKPSGQSEDFSEFDPDRAFAEIRADQPGEFLSSANDKRVKDAGSLQEALPIPEPVEASGPDNELLVQSGNSMEFADTTPPIDNESEFTALKSSTSTTAEHSIDSTVQASVNSGHAGSTVTMSDSDVSASSHEDYETLKDPRIPQSKQFFKIGEVSRITGLKPYVLRYWETEFSWVKPTKTSSRQRMYRRSDVVMLLKIKRLRYQDHHTIASAREEIRKSRKQERKNKSSVSAITNKSSTISRKTPIAESLRRSSPELVGKPAYAGPATANQLGLGFPTAPRAAELARRLSEMRRSVLEMIEVVKE